jgi:hypothetical protein
MQLWRTGRVVGNALQHPTVHRKQGPYLPQWPPWVG